MFVVRERLYAHPVVHASNDCQVREGPLCSCNKPDHLSTEKGKQTALSKRGWFSCVFTKFQPINP